MNNNNNNEPLDDFFPACVSVANEEEEEEHQAVAKSPPPQTRAVAARAAAAQESYALQTQEPATQEEDGLKQKSLQTQEEEDEGEEERAAQEDKERPRTPPQETAAAKEKDQEEEEDKEEEEPLKPPPLTAAEKEQQRKARILSRPFGKEAKKKELVRQLKRSFAPKKKVARRATSSPRKTPRRTPAVISKTVTPEKNIITKYEKVEVEEITPKANVESSPYRRSARTRVAPLAFWKNEKIVYGPNDDPDVNLKSMPVPKAIIRINDDDDSPSPKRGATSPKKVRPSPKKASPSPKKVSPSPKKAKQSVQKPTIADSLQKIANARSALRDVVLRSPPRQTLAKKTTQSKRMRVYESSDESDEESYGGTTRHSGRIRVPPLAYWRNEKMPRPMHNDPRVSKTKAPPAAARAKKSSKASSLSQKRKASSAMSEYSYLEGEFATLWDMESQQPEDTKAVAYQDRVEYRTLPRLHEQGIVRGRAAQAFGFQPPLGSPLSGYLTGYLVLPAQGVKEHESVGASTQIFTLVAGELLEVAYAADDAKEFDPDHAHRFLLHTAGDVFRVPPGNRYRLQNLSDDTECRLTWTIVRPHHS